MEDRDEREGTVQPREPQPEAGIGTRRGSDPKALSMVAGLIAGLVLLIART